MNSFKACLWKLYQGNTGKQEKVKFIGVIDLRWISITKLHDEKIKLVLNETCSTFLCYWPSDFPYFTVIKHNATGNPVLCKYGQDILCILQTILKNLPQYK